MTILPYSAIIHKLADYDCMDDEYLTRCVVDPTKKTFYLYSNEGDEKVVTCENTEQFMNVLKLVRATVDEDTLSYASPLL